MIQYPKHLVFPNNDLYPIPVPYDPSLPVTHPLNVDPWIKAGRLVPGQDINGHLVLCEQGSLAEIALTRRAAQTFDFDADPVGGEAILHEGFKQSQKTKRLPWIPEGQPFSDFVMNWQEHRDELKIPHKVDAANVNSHKTNLQTNLGRYVENELHYLVYEGVGNIANGTNMSQTERLNTLQTLNDIVDIATHVVINAVEICIEHGIDHDASYTATIRGSIDDNSERIDKHILTMWDEVNS